MPQFRYEGVNYSGKPVTGTIEAAGETEACARLRTTRIRANVLREKRPVFRISFSGSVRLKYLSAFTRQLASMTSSAIPLVQSLDAIAEQTENKTLRQAIYAISSDVQSGVALAEAMSRRPKIFNRLYGAMVRAGEAAGILPDVLLRLADYQEKAVNVRRRITSAFAYPLLVAAVAVAALIALLTFVIPTFSSMLAELGAQLPLSTRIVIGASDIARIWLLPFFAAAVVAAAGTVFLYRTSDKTRLSVDSLRLRLPLIGSLQKKSSVSRFSRTFGSLLSGGVPIAEALEITADTAGNRVLELGFRKTLEAIRSGQPLAQPLKETGVFPAMVIQMIGVGEKSGRLPEMLTKISDYYDTEVDAAVTTLTSILEPALIVAMGVFLAGVLIAMYLPMFEMVSSIG